MKNTRLARLACSLVFVSSIVGSTAANERDAQWLVDLARDYGLMQKEAPTGADVLYVDTLLKAALRIDPNHAEALHHRYEIALLGGNSAEVIDILNQLVAVEPNHKGVCAQWLQANVASQQTVEKREQWLQSILTNETRSQYLKSLACVYLAHLKNTQFDPQEPQQWIDRALGFDPNNGAALLAMFRLMPADATPIRRAECAFKLLRRNPLHVEAMWELACTWDVIGEHGQAAKTFEAALNVFNSMNPNEDIPADRWLDLTNNFLARGDIDKACEATLNAMESDPTRVEIAFLLHSLFEKKNDAESVEKVKSMLGERFGKIQKPNDWPVEEVAAAAWFHCRIDPQPHRAAMLAEYAASRDPENKEIQRILGWTQYLNQSPEKAIETLNPLAENDPYAAYLLAKLLRDKRDEFGARRVLKHLKNRPEFGPAWDLLATLGPAADPTQEEKDAKAKQQLTFATDFAEDIQLIDENRPIENKLEVAVTLDQPSMAPGTRWWAMISLKNPTNEPILLGPEWATNPVFLISFAMEGDKQRVYPGLMTITLDGYSAVQPGETVSIRKTLDVGPLRRASRFTPQQLQTVTLVALFDPVQGTDGTWHPGPFGQMLPAVRFNRIPANTSNEGINALFESLKTGSTEMKCKAVSVIAELIGEQQRAAYGRLTYKPSIVPTTELQKAILAALTQGSVTLRAHTLAAADVMGLDKATLAAAQKNLSHENWLVRMMAVRLLSRQGEVFIPMAEEIAAEDSDELVRNLATSLAAKRKMQYSQKTGQTTTNTDN